MEKTQQDFLLEDIESKLSLIVLNQTVLFPMTVHKVSPSLIINKNIKELIGLIKTEPNKRFAIISTKNSDQGSKPFYTGVSCTCEMTSDNQIKITAEAPCKIVEIAETEDNFLTAKVIQKYSEIHEKIKSKSDEIKFKVLQENYKFFLNDVVSKYNKEKYKDYMAYQEAMQAFPNVFCWLVAESLDLKFTIKQKILEETKYSKKLKTLTDLIVDRINSEKTVEQKRDLSSFIEKILKSDDKNSKIYDLAYNCSKNKFPKEIETILFREFSRIEKMNEQSGEFTTIENYIYTVCKIPWNTSKSKNHSFQKAKELLDQNHFGMDQVKTKILKHLSILKMSKNKNNGTIICLVGPPGVGKTSICKSIAKSLGREYHRIGLGGVSDESTIRGHRKTYVGAMSGKIVDALIKTKTKNPVIVLDEIDKLGRAENRGNIEAALLETLDPEQNSFFNDHYINSTIDLSEVIFIATANDYSCISKPLLDRMNVIFLEGYSILEKKEIAEKHIIPRLNKELNLNRLDITFSKDSIESIIQNYTAESGVRKLQEVIKDILETCAMRFLETGNRTFEISSNTLKDFLKESSFEKTKLKKKLETGVCTGLAWTQNGGDILYIESSLIRGFGNIQTTGMIGQVMSESIQVALNYIKSNEKKFKLNIKKDKDIHIHFPNGATPKDGPSAGVTITTAIISLLKNKEIPNTIAMTGEISLKGEVLPVGGIKEKLMSAFSAGIKTVFLPKENEDDFNKLPVDLKNTPNVSVIFVSHYNEIFDYIFKNG